jgi:hypothetical protein
MALKFTGVRVDDPINWRVAIQASDENGSVRCYVAHDALQDHVGVDVEPLAAFDSIAAQVQHALRVKDQAGGRAQDGSLTVGTADL